MRNDVQLYIAPRAPLLEKCFAKLTYTRFKDPLRGSFCSPAGMKRDHMCFPEHFERHQNIKIALTFYSDNNTSFFIITNAKF